MKFLDLFGKSSARHVKNVRLPAGRDDETRQATARKIDSIESEITSEHEAHALPLTEDTQTLSQCIEEASILYASRQRQATERLLLEAVSQRSGDGYETIAWKMLLELADFDQDRERFEALSLRYAERFETSPPQWQARSAAVTSSTVPTLAFRGKLLASSGPALAQLEQMAQGASIFVIDMQGVTEIDSAGCTGLLTLLRNWDAQRRQVSIAHSASLLALLRQATQHAEKSSDDGAWLLLIELLRISDVEAYENACIDYSIAFELSPPVPLSFTAAQVQGGAGLCLPAEIAMPIEGFLDSLRIATDGMDTIVLNGSQLQLIEFNAAAALLDGIAGLAKGKPVEWRDIPYLVSTLLQLVGGDGKLHIINRQP